MTPAPLPPEEPARLAALRGLGILDTPPEPAFDRVARIAAALLGVPIGVVSLVDADRQWFKARCGVDAAETPRDVAFCAHAILSDETLVVEDALLDPRFADSPLVTRAPHVRFYAGAPIVTQAGFRLGALCAIDTAPRSPLPHQLRALRDLAALVAERLELRLLARENAIFRAMIEAMPDLVYAKDASGRFLAANAATAVAVGAGSVEALLGRSDADFYPPELARAFRRDEEAVLARGEPMLIEETARRPDGSPGRYCSLKAPMRDEAGRVVGLVGHGRDVTEEAALRAELAATQQRLADALGSMADGLALYDEAGRLVLWNRQVEAFFPRTAGERRVGRPMAEVARAMTLGGEYKGADPGDPEGWVAAMWVALRSPAGAEIETASGRWLHGVARPTASGGTVIAYRDITERKERERELAAARVAAEAAAEAKARFLAQMSHELRTPLTAALGFAGLLEASPLSPEQKRQVGIILKTGKDLLAILNDVLDFSRLEKGQVEILRQPFRLRQPLEDLAPLATVLLAEKPVAFELDLAPDLPAFVAGDATRLKQILTNLLGNAAKFTERGRIRLAAEPAGGEVVRFSVSDTGPGIAPERQAGLFEGFSRLEPLHGRHGGTGLGLAIARQLAVQMGGRVGVASALGQGSTFWLELPLPAVAEPAPAKPPATAPSRPLSVLVVDDVMTNRMLLKALLERSGHRVRLAVDGAEAVAAVAAEPPDLVLMDVSMPVMDGLEATRRIRAAGGPMATLPIVALTAHAFAADVEACLAAGMDGHLPKPVEPEALERLVAGIAARP